MPTPTLPKPPPLPVLTACEKEIHDMIEAAEKEGVDAAEKLAADLSESRQQAARRVLNEEKDDD
jgi:hypothetical protein